MRTYRVLVDGVPAFETSDTTATVTGLTAGQTYSFVVEAVDNAGNASPSDPVTETVVIDAEYLQLTVSTVGSPEGRLRLSIRCGDDGERGHDRVGFGFAPIGYTLSVSAGSFVNADAGSPTPLMPPSVMEHAMSGDAVSVDATGRWLTRPCGGTGAHVGGHERTRSTGASKLRGPTSRDSIRRSWSTPSSRTERRGEQCARLPPSCDRP
jgi:hypothetical protein